MTSSVGMLMGCVVALLSVLFAFLQVSPGEMPFDPPESMITFSDTPQQLHSNRDGYTFGRFRSAVSDPNLREMNLLESTLQRKEWAFTAVSNGRFLVGMATADLGYVETGFLYFFDIHTGAHDSWQFLLPGVVNGAKIARSDVQDGLCSKFSTYFSQLHVEVCYRSESNSWRVDARAKTKTNCKIALQVDVVRGGEEFAMNYPIGPNRAGYTHKTGGLAVNGTLTLLPTNRLKAQHKGNQVMVNEPFEGVGLMDFTRSQSRRFTEWFWIALSYAAQDKESGKIYRHGLQFSTNTVGSLESVVWVDGQMFELTSPLIISFVNTSTNQSIVLAPGQQVLSLAKGAKYTIVSEDKSVNLEYFPRGVVPTQVTTPLIYGSFFHSYGVYRGLVGVGGEGGPVLKLDKPVAGVFEDHSVHW